MTQVEFEKEKFASPRIGVRVPSWFAKSRHHRHRNWERLFLSNQIGA